MFAENFQHIRQQPDARAEQDQSGEVERMRMRLAIIRQMAQDQIEAEQTHRQVDEKNHPPLKIAHDETAGHRAEHRADQARDGHEAHRADEFGFGKRPHQRQPPHRHHHRAAEPLQDPARHEQMDAVRNAAEQRAEGERADRPREHPARAEPVRHPAADGNEHRQTQRVAGEHRLHAQWHDAQRLRDGGHRRVQNRGVQRLHEEGHRHQPWQNAPDSLD